MVDEKTKTYKCAICKKTITVDTHNAEEFVNKHKWKGTFSRRGEKEIELWYCPIHSIQAIDNFEYFPAPKNVVIIEGITYDVDFHMKRIANMSRIDMGYLWRFAPIGHMYFNTALPFHEVFKKRFDELGGFSTIMSKQIGWEDKQR